MKKINWEIFFGDSSSEEALCLFAIGQVSFNEFSNLCSYSLERRNVINKLKYIGYRKSISNAKRALRTRGWNLTEIKNELKDWDKNVI